MNSLPAELKAELAAKKLAAEINMKIRAKGTLKPKFEEPADRKVKVLPEVKEDPYKRANPVSRTYEVFDFEESITIEQSNEPKFRPRKHDTTSRKDFDMKVEALINKYSTK